MQAIDDILAEDVRRVDAVCAVFDPHTGQGAPGERFRLDIPDHPISTQWLPVAMRKIPLIKRLIKYGTIDAFLRDGLKVEPTAADRLKVLEKLDRTRCLHDFPYWAEMYVRIKLKEGAEGRFILNRPQRIFLERLEAARLAGKPIRIVLLKARQWGGSTLSQMYMAWLQLVHKQGLNSLIIAHKSVASEEIRDMFDLMMRRYPRQMLAPFGLDVDPTEPKTKNVGRTGGIQRIIRRRCKIKIGTAESPDSCRGGDYSLVHLSEVGIWRQTDGRKPEEVVASACTGVRLRPYTMIVYESTAKGSDNFFHREYMAAKRGESQFEALFIPWYAIDWNTLPFEGPGARREFAAALWERRQQSETTDPRREPGAYLWRLWQAGATLEALHWYVNERLGKPSHDIMASECPSDDVEAFTFSGAQVFDEYLVDALREGVKPPRVVGEVVGRGSSGEEMLEEPHLVEDRTCGHLSVWEPPDIDSEERVEDRYLVSVDVGVGRSAKADSSVICVIDRFDLMDMGKPRVVAQWVGHIDPDQLAWKAAQIAQWYDHALLAVESNSLESHAGAGGAGHAGYVLNILAQHYDNLYMREASPDDIRAGRPRKYGFHTNAATKPLIIDHLVMAVREGLWVERDEGTIEELLTYRHTERGVYEAAPGRHDDRLMTRAIGLWIALRQMPVPSITRRINAATADSIRPQRRRLGGRVSESSF